MTVEESGCGGSTVMYVNRGKEDEMASEFFLRPVVQIYVIHSLLWVYSVLFVCFFISTIAVVVNRHSIFINKVA